MSALAMMQALDTQVDMSGCVAGFIEEVVNIRRNTRTNVVNKTSRQRNNAKGYCRMKRLLCSQNGQKYSVKRAC